MYVLSLDPSKLPTHSNSLKTTWPTNPSNPTFSTNLPPPWFFTGMLGKPHQRRGPKITATVRQTLERSILSSILKKFDGSVKKRHEKGYVFIPVFLSQKKPSKRPKQTPWRAVANFDFFLKKVFFFCFFGHQKRVLRRAFFLFPSGRVVATKNLDGYTTGIKYAKYTDYRVYFTCEV